MLVSFHGGAEGAKHQHVPNGKKRRSASIAAPCASFTHAMIDAGADLVLGHGPHVVRGSRSTRQRLIAYSLGNFATYAMFNLNGPNGLTCILQTRLGGRWTSPRRVTGPREAVQTRRTACRSRRGDHADRAEIVSTEISRETVR
ncbi:MAG: CapA family protein [Ignavibacteria bacterium]|nr:CapA family protein [Ignavibacteria bacterium]